MFKCFFRSFSSLCSFATFGAIHFFSARFKASITLLVFLLGLLFSPVAFSHGHGISEKEIEVSLALFEKAVQLSPELLPQASSDLVPYYKINGDKMYLNEPMWGMVRMWMELYKRDIQTVCICDIDSDFLIEEAKNYIAKNPIISKASHEGKELSEELLLLAVELAAKYGYPVAIMKITAEIAETIISVSVGGKGIHLICEPIDLVIFPLARKAEKSYRFFFYGGEFSRSRWIFASRMAFIARRINRSQKRVFFTLHQALEFNKEELEKLNAEGPKSLGHSKGHRLLWLEKKKAKTDPLFEKIATLKQELENPDLSEKEQAKKQKKIQKLEREIERIVSLIRKDFFGKRFKRYLGLSSRKSRTAYMNGEDLKHDFKFIMKKDFWPLGIQYLMDHSLLNSKPDLIQSPKPEETSNRPYKDEVVSSLIEEFLENINSDPNQIHVDPDQELKKSTVESFITDLHIIFDTHLKTEKRLMSARQIELFFSFFLAHYLSVAKKKVFAENKDMSFEEKRKLVWRFGYIQNLGFQFSDFLSAVAIAKDPKKINPYKYEAIEKFFAFLVYFNQIRIALKKPNLKMSDLLNDLEQNESKVEASLSIIKQNQEKVEELLNAIQQNQTKLESFLSDPNQKEIEGENLTEYLKANDLSMEDFLKTLAQNEPPNGAKVSLDFEAFFTHLDQKEHEIKSLSLARKKKTAISVVPFKKAKAQCNRMVKKYQ